jgi:hypothetical protein
MIYDNVSGGPELLTWFGEEPTFHDAEVISLSLSRTGPSELKIHGWIATDDVDPNGYIVLDKHAIVTFSLEGVMDLQLDGFSGQNVVGGLVLRYATDRGRSSYYRCWKTLAISRLNSYLATVWTGSSEPRRLRSLLVRVDRTRPTNLLRRLGGADYLMTAPGAQGTITF